MSDLPGHASVVVIGGGVVGAACARHLGTLGCRDAILLERSKIGSGTTWHAAGNMETWRADPLIGEMVAYAVRLFPELERETGISFGWRQTGRIHFTADEHVLSAYRAVPGRARARGVDVQFLTPDEILAKLPIISGDGLLGGLWTPNDGRVDPTNLAMAHARGAAMQGVKVFEDCGVQAIRTEAGRVVAVVTGQGEVRCDAVVLAAGLWSTALARSCGVRLPLMALHHFYLLTKPIDGLSRDLPLFLSYDERIYGREDVGGLLMGVFDADAIPLEPDELPEQFSFSLLPENWDQIQSNLPVVMRRFPLMEQAEIRMLVNGPESFTPDGEMLLGEHPQVRGLHLATGMNSNGIALSSAVGLVTAERLVHGRSALDTTRLDIRRFAPFQGGDRYRRARMSEIPDWFCRAHGPGGDFVGTRQIRRSPFHERHVRANAVFATIAGLERPAWFAGTTLKPVAAERIAAELAAAGEAAWSDRSGDTVLWLEGAGAADLLAQITGDPEVATPGQATLVPFLNDDGGIEALPTVLALTRQRFMLLAGPDEGVALEHFVRQRLDGLAAALVDVGSGYAQLDLHGARIPQVLAGLGASGSPVDAGRVAEATLAYAPVLLARTSPDGPVRVIVRCDFAGALTDALGEVPAIGSEAADALRILRREPAFGREATPWRTPAEVGLATAGAGDSGRSGRRCRAFVLDDEHCGSLALEPVFCGGRTVGHVTSSTHVPYRGRITLLAWIDDHAAGDFSVLVDGQPRPMVADTM